MVLELSRPHLGEPFDGELAGGVGSPPGSAAAADTRGDADDVAAMLENAGVEHSPGDEVDPGHVYVEYLAKSLFGIVPDLDSRTERAGVLTGMSIRAEARRRPGDPCVDGLGQFGAGAGAQRERGPPFA